MVKSSSGMGSVQFLHEWKLNMLNQKRKGKSRDFLKSCFCSKECNDSFLYPNTEEHTTSQDGRLNN